MARIPSAKTDEELDEHAVLDAVRTFIAVQGRDWQRRQLNLILPAVKKEVLAAQAAGNSVDVGAVLRKVWLQRELPSLS